MGSRSASAPPSSNLNIGGTAAPSWAVVIPASAYFDSPRASKSIARSGDGAGIAPSIAAMAVSSSTPVGSSPPGARRILPPAGSGDSAVMPAASRALLLAVIR